MGRCGEIVLRSDHETVLVGGFSETKPRVSSPALSYIKTVRKLALFSSFFVSVEAIWEFGDPGSGEILYKGSFMNPMHLE